MRSIQVRSEGGDGTEYAPVSLPVTDLVERLCGRYEAIAPFDQLNEKLRGGGGGGQAGATYWDGFALSRSEFEELSAVIERRSGLTVLDAPSWAESFSDWAVWRIHARIGVPDEPIRAYVEDMRPADVRLDPIETRIRDLSQIAHRDESTEAEMNELFAAQADLHEQISHITRHFEEATEEHVARAQLSTTVRGLAAPFEVQLTLIDERTAESILSWLESRLRNRELRLEAAEHDAAQALLAELRRFDPERSLDESILGSDEWARVRDRARDVARACDFGEAVPDHL